MYKRHAPSQGLRGTKRTKTSKQPKKINKGTYLTAPIARQELKARPQYYTGTVTSGGFITVMGTVDIGDQYYERTGRAIRHVSSDVYLQLIQVANSGSPVTSCRVIYGIWKQAHLSPTPSVSDVLETASFSGGEVVAPFNSKYSSSFIILWDDIWSLNSGYNGAATNSGAYVHNKKKSFTYKGVQEYGGDEDGDVNNWSHFMLILPNQSAQFKIGAQHYFTDA